MTGKSARVKSMERKSDKVRGLTESGDYKAALRIAKDFRLGISADQRSAMTRAYECMVHPAFYKSIGVDLAQAIEHGVSVLVSLYG